MKVRVRVQKSKVCPNFVQFLLSMIGTSTVDMISFFPLLYKVSRPYKQAEFEIIFGEGASKLVSL